MATKKRPARKRAPAKRAAAKKPTNSKIQEAQKAAVERRIERDSLRQQSEAERSRAQKDPNNPSIRAGNSPLKTPIAAQVGPVGRAANMASRPYQKPQGNKDDPTFAGASQAADKIAGLMAPIMAERAKASAEARKKQNALADVSLYGNSNKNRAAKIAQLQNAYTQQASQQLKTQGRAVWMGPVQGQRGGVTGDGRVGNPMKIRNQGPERQDENGKTYTVETGGDQILTKEELMSWLTDDTKVKQIIAFAQKAGLAVETYDDAAKLWGSVVDMAASSYSFAGKQVTPWSIIQLRGKNAGPGGKPKDRLVTSRTVDEVSPADARLMFEKTAQDQLGRTPTKAEVDDFIAKAQTIAKGHPDISYTTQHYGFDGEVESQDVRNSPGGSQALQAQAALDQAKGSEDYAAYQAAGVYMPWLMDALASPV